MRPLSLAASVGTSRLGFDEAAVSFSARFAPVSAVPSVAPPAGSERANAAMDRYARGDDAAFADVYDSIAPRVYAYLLRQTREPASAADLLQQTLLQIHRNRGRYLTDCAVLPWAFAIARRLLIDEIRRRKTDALWSARAVAEDDRLTATAPEDEVVSRELAARVSAELSRLPENQRVAFELLRMDGLSHDEAAQVLGTTVSAVKLRAFRAYSALRAALGPALEASDVEDGRQKA
jgi:RNA polymerase sigma-70 factor (ECF subfamily)